MSGRSADPRCSAGQPRGFRHRQAPRTLRRHRRGWWTLLSVGDVQQRAWRNQADLSGKPVEFALPNVLVRLSLEHERMFTY